ncbi:MAG TPA: DUF4382 domain-containing protein [Burkholderiales bacterium]|nr:DUF4382 domain-containing protein [Burkholderiales bacterium]
MAILAIAAISGCGGGGGGSSNGMLGVSLTDAPACGFDAVNVTVSKFRVHMNAAAPDSAGGWSEITLNPPRKINLLDLTNGLLEDLGETPLPAGHYTQMRLVLEANTGSNPLANSVIPTGSAETALKTPSATQSGIKLVNPFTVASGQRADFVLDFDACKSVVKNGNGNYLLKPVIKIVPNTANGIDGFVQPALISGNNVVVSAQVNGEVVASTVPASTGKFFLARLAPGTYDVVVSAKGHATAVIATVPVADATSVVTLSTSTAPIVLPTSAVSHSISGTVLLNPVNADQVIFVSAKQDVLPATILVPATTVTVRAQSADLTTGAYSLLLPAGAPLLGQFGALPITLDAQTNPAGKYVIEASATGYATQTSFEENVSTSDQPNVNLTLLVP